MDNYTKTTLIIFLYCIPTLTLGIHKPSLRGLFPKMAEIQILSNNKSVVPKNIGAQLSGTTCCFASLTTIGIGTKKLIDTYNECSYEQVSLEEHRKVALYLIAAGILGTAASLFYLNITSSKKNQTINKDIDS